MFRTLIAALALLISAHFFAVAQQPTQIPGFKESYTIQSFRIPMRDGVRLFTTVYSPKDQSEKWPFLMMRTPYGIDPDPYVPGVYAEPHETIRGLLKEGYIMVEQDVRGRFYSEGQFDDVRPLKARPGSQSSSVDESTDTYDTIEWLLKCIPNNNGRVGIWGISYPGFYAAAAGRNAHPALRAISPQAPVSDWFMGDDDHHNGALMLVQSVRFFNSFGRDRAKRDVQDDNYLPEAPMDLGGDAYRFYLGLGPLKNVDARYFHGEVKHWTNITLHPDYDSWWKARALPQHLKNVKCAVLMVGGWYDTEDKYGPTADYAAIKRDGKSPYNGLVMGPWSHGGWSGGDASSFGDERFGFKTGPWYRDHLFKPFFDHFLKDRGVWKNPEVTVFATGRNEFWNFASWPPADTEPMVLTPGNDGALRTGSASIEQARASDSYVSDPAQPVPYVLQTQAGTRGEYVNDDQRFAAGRKDVLTYQTSPLTEEVSVVGRALADLQISTTGSDADFIVKVIDVQPEGSPGAGVQRLVRAEVMRARFRNSFSKPEAITPGKRTRVAFSLDDICHVFKKGHRIMVQIQSSWFPLVDRNPQTFVPNIYLANDSDFQKATIRVFHNSKIVLPRLKRIPAAIAIEQEYLVPIVR